MLLCQIAIGMKIHSRATTLHHRRSNSRCAVTFSHLNWIHKLHRLISKCNFSVGTSSNLNNLDLLAMILNQRNTTEGTTSQPSSRAAKSGKFTLLSRAMKQIDRHLEVLSFQNRKSFHRTLRISPKDLEGFKADIAFIYTALASSLAISTKLNFIFCNAKFHWFVRHQRRILIG